MSAGRPGPMLWRDAPTPSVMPEEIEPGWTLLNRMRSLLNSSARAWVIAWMPPLEAA